VFPEIGLGVGQLGGSCDYGDCFGAKIMAGCKNVDGRETSIRVSACGSGGMSEAVDRHHQQR
jgi:hypothetical protein